MEGAGRARRGNARKVGGGVVVYLWGDGFPWVMAESLPRDHTRGHLKSNFISPLRRALAFAKFIETPRARASDVTKPNI